MSIIDRFAVTLPRDERRILDDIQAYATWQVGRQDVDFAPTDDDDVEIRNYLLHLRISRLQPAQLEQTILSLQRFYDWALAEGVINEDPFREFDYSRPFLSEDELRRRQETLPESPAERELTLLRGLNKLAQRLNRAVDIESALDAAIKTILPVMDLDTAWIFLLPNLHQHIPSTPVSPPHDFALVRAINLPPGLELEDRRFLCQPGDCHCQLLLRQGRLQRAVNVVECTRLLDAARANGENRNLNFHASVPLLIDGQWEGILNVATENWQFLTGAELHFLSTIGAQVAVALERARLYDLSREYQARISQELKMAREVQDNLLPRVLPEIPGGTLAAHWQSAREIAGDFYDAFVLPDGRIVLLVADVSDKGTHAALYMAMVSSLIRTYARLVDGPAALMNTINRELLKHDTAAMFVTLFYGVLNIHTGKLTYASAGHDPPLLRRYKGQIELLMPTGPLLGILDPVRYDEQAVVLKAGDMLLMNTDGVTDMMNEDGEAYGRERLEICWRHAPKTATTSLQYLREDLDRFRGKVTPPDDITCLILSLAPPVDDQV